VRGTGKVFPLPPLSCLPNENSKKHKAAVRVFAKQMGAEGKKKPQKKHKTDSPALYKNKRYPPATTQHCDARPPVLLPIPHPSRPERAKVHPLLLEDQFWPEFESNRHRPPHLFPPLPGIPVFLLVFAPWAASGAGGPSGDGG